MASSRTRGPQDVELWRHWARRRYQAFTVDHAQALAEQREVFGREAAFVHRETLYAFLGVGSVGARRVRELTQLVAIGVHPVLALMVTLYRARRQRRNAGGTGSSADAHLLTWPLRGYIRKSVQWRFDELDEHVADLLPRGSAEIRAACALQWPALRRAATTVRRRLAGQFVLDELQAHRSANPWPSPQPLTYAEVLAWLQRTWERQWVIHTAAPHEWLRADASLALNRVAHQLLARSRLALRWQRAIENLILFDRPEPFWEEIILGQVRRIQYWAGSPIDRSAASRYADLGFPLPRDEGPSAGQLMRDLVGASELVAGLREPSHVGEHGHAPLVLLRDMRAHQIFVGLARRGLSRTDQYVQTLVEIDKEIGDANSQGLITAAMQNRLTSGLNAIALRRAIERVQITLPTKLDGKRISSRLLEDLLREERERRTERQEFQAAHLPNVYPWIP